MPQRVCFVSLASYGYFNPDSKSRGGAGRQISLLSRELVGTFDVHVIVGDYGQAAIERWDGVTIHRAYPPAPDASLLAKPRQALTLYRTMKRVDADVYVYRGQPYKASFVYLLARLLGKPWIYNLASDSNVTSQPAALPTPLRKLFERGLIDASTVIAQTDRQAQLLADRFTVDSRVVPNGYPAIPDEPTPFDDRSHFLWVGRIEAGRKRPDLYLDLAEQVPHATFVLIGPDGQDSEYTDAIRSRAGELGNVTDVGVVDPDEIHEFYKNAIAFVNTSSAEGFPNTFLEAWRYDTPVVSLHVDPNRFVEPDIDGCAEGDFQALSDLTRRLNDDVEFREKLGTKAGEYVRSELSIESVADQYATAIMQALGRHESR